MKLSPWQKIAKAGKSGRGLRLSFEEVQRLCMDDAILTRAALDDFPELETKEREFDAKKRQFK